jgi:hypothetical protein
VSVTKKQIREWGDIRFHREGSRYGMLNYQPSEYIREELGITVITTALKNCVAEWVEHSE